MNIIRVVRKVRLTKGRIGRILVNKRCTGCYIYKPGYGNRWYRYQFLRKSIWHIMKTSMSFYRLAPCLLLSSEPPFSLFWHGPLIFRYRCQTDHLKIIRYPSSFSSSMVTCWSLRSQIKTTSTLRGRPHRMSPSLSDDKHCPLYM